MYLKPKPISKAELKTTEGWTKTATLLIKVFGEQAFIIEFDRCRKNFFFFFFFFLKNLEYIKILQVELKV